jgi:hypothetical protein
MPSKKKGSRAKRTKLKGIQKTEKFEKSGAIRKDAFVSSRNKRDQAKNDKRSPAPPSESF